MPQCLANGASPLVQVAVVDAIDKCQLLEASPFELLVSRMQRVQQRFDKSDSALRKHSFPGDKKQIPVFVS